MSDRRWMAGLTDEQRRALVWRCIWCGRTKDESLRRSCSAPDGDGHMFEPVKPKVIDPGVNPG